MESTQQNEPTKEGAQDNSNWNQFPGNVEMGNVGVSRAELYD